MRSVGLVLRCAQKGRHKVSDAPKAWTLDACFFPLARRTAAILPTVGTMAGREGFALVRSLGGNLLDSRTATDVSKTLSARGSSWFPTGSLGNPEADAIRFS